MTEYLTSRWETTVSLPLSVVSASLPQMLQEAAVQKFKNTDGTGEQKWKQRFGYICSVQNDVNPQLHITEEVSCSLSPLKFLT